MLKTGRQIVWFVFWLGLTLPIALLIGSFTKTGRDVVYHRENAAAALAVYVGSWVALAFLIRCGSILNASLKKRSDLRTTVYRHVTDEVEAKHFDKGLMTRVRVENHEMGDAELEVAYIKARVDFIIAHQDVEPGKLIRPSIR